MSDGKQLGLLDSSLFSTRNKLLKRLNGVGVKHTIRGPYTLVNTKPKFEEFLHEMKKYNVAG